MCRLLQSKLCDHQCGFKAYRVPVLCELVKEIQMPHWSWDTESLILAQRKRCPVDEFSVVWTKGPGTTVRFKDVKEMGTNILKLRKRLDMEKKLVLSLFQ